MSPRTRDVLEAWTIGIFTLIALAMALTGCRTIEAETITSVEEALVDRTAQYAAKLDVKVRGVVTDWDCMAAIATPTYRRPE